MKTWKVEILKTLFIMSLPVYGGFLWGFMQLGLTYWLAWFLANLAYTPVIYAMNRFSVFRERIKNVEV